MTSFATINGSLILRNGKLLVGDASCCCEQGVCCYCEPYPIFSVGGASDDCTHWNEAAEAVRDAALQNGFAWAEFGPAPPPVYDESGELLYPCGEAQTVATCCGTYSYDPPVLVPVWNDSFTFGIPRCIPDAFTRECRTTDNFGNPITRAVCETEQNQGVFQPGKTCETACCGACGEGGECPDGCECVNGGCVEECSGDCAYSQGAGYSVAVPCDTGCECRGICVGGAYHECAENVVPVFAENGELISVTFPDCDALFNGNDPPPAPPAGYTVASFAIQWPPVASRESEFDFPCDQCQRDADVNGWKTNSSCEGQCLSQQNPLP